MNKIYEIHSLNDMKEFGKKLAREVSTPKTILFYGDLGTGKTEICRAMIQELTGSEIAVPSPTFTIVQTYDSRIGKINHFDLYRIKNESELVEIGLEDAILSGLTLIEWPELAKSLINPKNTMILKIKRLADESRKIEIS